MSMPGGVMVARRTLDAKIGVRIPAGQPFDSFQSLRAIARTNNVDGLE